MRTAPTVHREPVDSNDRTLIEAVSVEFAVDGEAVRTDTFHNVFVTDGYFPVDPGYQAELDEQVLLGDMHLGSMTWRKPAR